MSEHDAGNAPVVTEELRGHVLLMGLNRPAKRNAFNLEMLHGLVHAYQRLEDDPDAWVGVLFAHGDHFTAGLDLAEVASRIAEGEDFRAAEGVDPWGLVGRDRTKPVVAVAQGRCLTLGIELLLASDIRIAAADSRFSQLEVQRGIYPFGGATIRFPQEAGWGNAMRWLLTGDDFDVAEALRIGLVQEVVDTGAQLARAVELAEHIARRAAPLGVRATLASARRARVDGHQAAADRLAKDVAALFHTADAAEGVASFIERRPADFQGR
ncbi:crotonase/enoyl-CoA hydratase family protein [Streptomyces sp. NA02950]|uniref:crotonase/enoyl-CoA hydratase family protein n=1 Tax=Streptomyces sp. NA02950 TaxID=2742137 RepID=UPI0015911572|nr:crotonase/enoyl-CoA hydratase family protein [Streptomyces sp. NA02950]QKV96471.1 crotonase/enoyl-CoA hydratase family protein [Streptomyces sp. NA02950]